jgi:F-type H+-transporting ATPase subunit a
VTLPLALITFVMIQYINIKENKFGAFTALFKPIPLFFPINLIGEIATPLSMSLRLFGNILSGTVMMSLIYGLLPVFVKIGIPAALHIYFDLFAGAIQTYVFCMLTMVFVTDKMATEE